MKKEDIKISEHFDLKRLLSFTASPIVMMVFTSMYNVMDGIMVSNGAGEYPLASINIVWPLIMIISCVGLMIGTGGSAEIAKTIGEKQPEKAKEYFSFLVYTVIIFGVVLSSICYFNLRKLCYLFGASDLLIDDCLTYGRILLFGTPFLMLQSCFQSFLTTAQKPKIALCLTVAAGFSNIILDYLFIIVLKMGVKGAAIATITGFFIGGFIPLIYFSFPNDSLLCFTPTKVYLGLLVKSCANGISEMLTNVSTSIVSAIYNVKLMSLIGELGVSAFSILMYVDFLFRAMMFGFSIGTAPIVSYNYGANNHEELTNIFKMSYKIMISMSIIMSLTAFFSADLVSGMFVKDNLELKQLTSTGLKIFSLGYLVCGINIFASNFFTSLCNGLLSGIISFLKALIMPVVLINVLADLLGVKGIFLAMPLGEVFTIIVSITFIIKNQKKYHYSFH